MKSIKTFLSVFMAVLMLVLSCTFLLALPGCIGKESGSTGLIDPATEQAAPTAEEERSYCFDFRRDTFYSVGNRRLVETDDAVYFLSGKILYFSDKDYKDWMPLCARPNCSHKDKDCDAYLETGCGITVYDKYIYYVDSNTSAATESEAGHLFYRPVLCRMRLDGSRHEDVCSLPLPDFSFEPDYNTWSMVFTNKYLVVSVSVVEDMETLKHESADYVMDLDTLQYRPCDSPNTRGAIYGSGDLLYSFGGEAEMPALTVFDCATGKTKDVGILQGPFGYTVVQSGFDFIDGCFYYTINEREANELSLYRMELSTGASTLIAKENAMTSKWYSFDQTNHFLFNSFYSMHPDYIDQTREEWGFYVFDVGLEPVDCLLYAGTDAEQNIMTVTAQTDSYIYGTISTGVVDTTMLPTWYIDKSEIGTGSLQWRRWEP